MKILACIRIRGRVDVQQPINQTMDMLRIGIKHACSLIPDNQIGMLRKAKDYITWGEINKETLVMLLKKRAMISNSKKVTEGYLKEKGTTFEKLADEILSGKSDLKTLGIKPFFRLNPPRKGYGKKGIKKAFKLGGPLGYRGENINDFLKGMM